jgi:fluoroacetyl-CoA thioesterase
VKQVFQTGDQKIYETRVTEDKLAIFDAGMVHPVYSTFALGKDVEWACRLFVLEMKESGEEGVGAALSIEHLYPAPLHSEVSITATLTAVEKNIVTCSWEAHANGHCIAKGSQVQRIISKDKFDQLIASIAEKL